MKKILWLIGLLVIVVLVVVWSSGDKNPGGQDVSGGQAVDVTSSPVPVIETTKVSSKTSKFENSELGFSLNYPTAWEAENTDSGVKFIMPIDKSQVSTLAKLEAKVQVYASKCAFPPVTTIKDRGTIKIGDQTANMISMSNTVQGRAYFDRMYSIQMGNFCYMFAFSSIALSPESKGLTGSNITQAQNNNKAIINTADTDFTTMVKSFTFVKGPEGQEETKVRPANQ